MDVKSLIRNFSPDTLKKFFRSKIYTFKSEEDHYYLFEEKDDIRKNYEDIAKIGEADLGNSDEIIIIAAKSLGQLTNRTGKKRQYDIAKKILKKEMKDAAFFIFYDKDKNFRFSFIKTNYNGQKRDFTDFKRYTYFISQDQTNKTFISRISKCNFNNLNSIQEAFSVEPVTKEFYGKLQRWYFWAIKNVKFPDDIEKNEEKRNSQNIIRFITRFMFVWFLKEKSLIPEKIFDRNFIYENIIENKDKTGSTYYKAILQNLFFATLNTKMDERRFIKNSKGSRSNNYGVHNLYRYKRFLKNQDENLIIDLFKDIPFLNGGLFECLDKIKSGKNDEIRIDMFSDNPKNETKLVFPDELLFGDERDYDLNNVFDTKNKKYKVEGLINILKSYNFTVDENEPDDVEIALDPELLGSIFENLLASYNPETSTTARKATGSYYTPREIVNFMVDISIKQYLKTKNSKINDLDSKLEKLFDNHNSTNPFNQEESKEIVKSINKMKILDPACGSGAFPMGILNRSVKILEKLDPNNEIWRIEKLENLDEKSKDYKERLKQVERIFDMQQNEANYARKLFLIEDCIYGVDIQPIAIQIAKLRFFISLIVEQKIDENKGNRGILTLPNLETKFVSANTLLGIKKPTQMSLTENTYKEIENQLKIIRRKYFEARTHKTKEKYRKLDEELRERLKIELKKLNFPEATSEKIASWNPYDRNKSADFFDPEFMFGEKELFDIVIGNPPYIQLQKSLNNKIKYGDLYKNDNYETFDRMGDIYALFYEKGIKLLKDNGILCYITSNKWMRANYGKKLRRFLSRYNPQILIDLGSGIFDSATVDTNILFVQKNRPNKVNLKAVIYTGNKGLEELKDKDFTILSNLSEDGWAILSPEEQKIKERIEKIGIPLKDWDIKIYRGVLTGFNNAFIIDGKTKDELIKKDIKNKEIIKPLLRGRDIKRYGYEFADLWLINTHNGLKHKNIPPVDVPKDYPVIYEWLKQFEEKLKKRSDKGDNWWNLRNCAYLDEFEKEKIIFSEIVGEPQFHYDTEKYYIEATSFIMTGECLKYLVVLLNSKPITYFFKIFYAGGGLGTNGYRYKKAYLEKLPIPKIPENEQISFIENADKMLELNKKFITKKNEFLKSLNLNKITKKLETFYDLNYKEFLKELKKQKITIDNDLENRFNNYKEELNEIMNEIEKTDKEIDKMVYKLYNLVEEEAEIIEESLNKKEWCKNE